MTVANHLLLEGADLESTRSALAEHLELRTGRARSGSITFYDTFDGRVNGEGATLQHADGRLQLSDRASGEVLASAELPKVPSRLFAEDLPEPLRDRLDPVIEMRALAPVAKVRTRRLPLAVLNDDQKTVVRLVIETLDAGATPLRGRLVATAVRGYDRDLERVQDVLGSTLRLPETIVPLVDDAIVATGGRPAGTSAKLDLALTPEQPAEQAAAIVFARLLEVIDENLPGTLDDIDSEFLHDLRVAVRRTRSLQRQFKAVYPDRLQHFRDEFKRLQAVTGDLRDLDVYLLDFDALRAALPEKLRADLDPLQTVIVNRRARALTATRRALKARRTQDMLADWAAFIHEVPDVERSVSSLASHRIASVYRKMVKMGRAIDDSKPAEDLHELRKVGKELRYLLEFFASLYPADVVKPMVKSLKGLQDMLGRFQDREVQANALRELAPEVAEPRALMAMGVLVERFMTEEAAARAEFADRFADFASKEQRRLVQEHFA
jgi:CHAD domain-containing protein